jgi:hypothetical protein
VAAPQIPAYDRAAQMAFPWAPEAYPGLLRGMVELLGGRAALRTILDWRRGRRRPPQWAVEMLQDKLRSKARSMLESVEELEAEKQERGARAACGRGLPPRARVMADAVTRLMARSCGG